MDTVGSCLSDSAPWRSRSDRLGGNEREMPGSLTMGKKGRSLQTERKSIRRVEVGKPSRLSVRFWGAWGRDEIQPVLEGYSRTKHCRRQLGGWEAVPASQDLSPRPYVLLRTQPGILVLGYQKFGGNKLFHHHLSKSKTRY